MSRLRLDIVYSIQTGRSYCIYYKKSVFTKKLALLNDKYWQTYNSITKNNNRPPPPPKKKKKKNSC